MLGVLIAGLPGDGTALWRAGRRDMPKNAKTSAPPDEFWTAERDLLATIVDQLAILIWQPTKDGSKGRNAPKPIRRPGVRDSGTHMGTPVSAAEAMKRLRPKKDPPPVQ